MQRIVTLAVDMNGERSRDLERHATSLLSLRNGVSTTADVSLRSELLKTAFPQILRRELDYKGLLGNGASFTFKLLGWVEVA